jgi:hypothetical protein
VSIEVSPAFPGKNLEAALRKAFLSAYGEVPAELEFEWDIKHQFYVVAGKLKDGNTHLVKCTPEYLETMTKSDGPSEISKNLVAYAMAAFGAVPSGASPLPTGLGAYGNLILAAYAGKCKSCGINFTKQTVIIYGCPYGKKYESWHPGCFLAAADAFEGDGILHKQELAAAALGAFIRTADEMRWRRRSKAKCEHYFQPKTDPTLPEYHKWRCSCPTAPWNLTKAGRRLTRKKHGVEK